MSGDEAMDSIKLAIVVPCYNEEAVLRATNDRLLKVVDDLIAAGEISQRSFVIYVDDGSKDGTWESICALSRDSKQVKGIKLTKNFGHQNALLAGLMRVRGQIDAAISIDCDLQQDEKKIPSFVKKYKEGNDIVYGVRRNRKTDSALKKTTALFFYKAMRLMGVDIIDNSADYRLIGKNVLDILPEYREVNLFLRGLFPHLGFKSDIVYHDVAERSRGKSKYSFAKMLGFALTGVTSFSVVPMRLIALVGFLIFFLSIMMGIYVVTSYFVLEAVTGWASTVLPIYFIGGIQLFSLGVIGEYIGKIYMETKQRPRYLIEKET